MSMFKKFGTVQYALDGYSKEAMNILTAAVVKRLNVDQSYVYQRYVIPDGATPESLANDLYKDPEKYWTILLVNGIINPFLDWPMDTEILEKWVNAQYGSLTKVLYFTNVNSGKIYDDVDSKVFFDLMEAGEPLPYQVHPVTCFEHETILNQEKTQITVITNKYINLFVDTFNKSIEGKQ